MMLTSHDTVSSFSHIIKGQLAFSVESCPKLEEMLSHGILYGQKKLFLPVFLS